MKRQQIKRVEPTHAADIVKIAEDCGLAPWSEQDYIDDLGRPDSISFRIADLEDRTVGFIIGRLFVSSIRSGLYDAEIYNIGIVEDMRKQGLGNALLSEFLMYCRKNGVRNVFLEVRVSNKNAVSFYEGNGFVCVSTRKDFYTNPTEDAFVMQLTIDDDLSLILT